MNGDISLSGALGGLRIANPDDEDSQLASSSPPIPQTAELGTSIASPLSEESAAGRAHQLPSAEAAAGRGQSPNENDKIQRKEPVSMSQAVPGRSAHLAPAGGPSEYEQLRRTTQTGQDTRNRPVSALYNHPNSSTTSTNSNRDLDRYAHEQPRNGMSRTYSNDRAYPGRQYIERDRYRMSQSYATPPYPGSNGGPPPARRLSRHLAQHSNTSNQLAGSPYGVEGGPLPSSEEWKDRGAAVSTRQEIDADGNPVSRIIKKGVKDFNFGRTLGEGSYSTVLAATDRHTGREYAIKVLDKRHIIKEKKVKYVNIEKDTLNRLTDHPGVVRLYYTFQDERSLYFVLDLASGGELLGVLKKTGTFDVECSRYYAAQILDSIAYMHSRGIIHRDLKPENVLLDSNMHTKVTDFGTAKILKVTSEDGARDTAGHPLDGGAETEDRAKSFVGTAEYVSPELLTDKTACKASDLWAFGCIVYQLLVGRPPFKASNEYQTFQKIVALEYQFPDGFPPVAKDLVERLLVLDPAARLPMDQIRAHPFFEGVQWGRGLWRTKAPKLKPYVPPPAETIRLNGPTTPHPPTNLSPTTSKSPMTSPGFIVQAAQRPQLRSVTELPPPSQLDIDWSPVLTRHNERILKMGNLIVNSTPISSSPQQANGTPETTKKFSRFFGGSPRRKERLVMITSTARLLVVPAGGEEKRLKMELPLMAQGVNCRTYQDTRGLTAFCVDAKDKQYTFEDPRGSPADPAGSKFSTGEWMETIDMAKGFANSQSVANSYSAASQYTDMSSAMNSPTTAEPDTSDQQGQIPPLPSASSSSRNFLRKDGEADSIKKKNRFSRRQSRSGLNAVF